MSWCNLTLSVRGGAKRPRRRSLSVELAAAVAEADGGAELRLVPAAAGHSTGGAAAHRRPGCALELAVLEQLR